jgi:hypothetical protein
MKQRSMKKLTLLLAAVAATAVVGCERQGGTSDDYNRSTGSGTTRSNYTPVAPQNAPSSTVTNTLPAPTQP